MYRVLYMQASYHTSLSTIPSSPLQAALEQRHAAELAERHSRLSKCGASLGSATAALEERERQVTLNDKRIKELEQQVGAAKGAGEGMLGRGG